MPLWERTFCRINAHLVANLTKYSPHYEGFLFNHIVEAQPTALLVFPRWSFQRIVPNHVTRIVCIITGRADEKRGTQAR